MLIHQVFHAMMEHDRDAVCGPKNVPNPDRHAYRGGSAPSEVVLGGRRIVLSRLRARTLAGEELTLPSFAYASVHDPLDARTLEAIPSACPRGSTRAPSIRCRPIARSAPRAAPATARGGVRKHRR